MAVSLAELEVLISLQTIGQGQLNGLKSSLLGMATGAGLAAIGIGGLYEIGKSALSNYEAQQAASSQLAQAFATQGESVPTTQIQAFLDKNKAFISNQYDAEQAIANATRAGISWKDTQLLMGDAMNLSIDRGISMSDAMDTLTKAAVGGRAQLTYLGITATQLTATTNDVTNAQKAATAADDKKAAADRTLLEYEQHLHDAKKITQNDLMHLQDLKAKDLSATQAATDAHSKLTDAMTAVNGQGDRALVLHDLLAPKLKKESDTVSQLQQDQNKLNTDWQNFSANIGPGVSSVLDGVFQALDAAVQAAEAMGGILGSIGDWLSAHTSLGGASVSGNVGGISPHATPQGHANNAQTVRVVVAPAPGTIARVTRQMTTT